MRKTVKTINTIAALTFTMILTGCGSKNDTSEIKIIALKAGSADAFVLESENTVTIIDTGLDKNKEELVDFLKEENITKVDNLIITHFDKDHVGGADSVIDEFDIGKVYATYQSKESDDITEYYASLSSKNLTETVVTNKLEYEADGITYTIYPPESDSYSDSESNNSSLVIRIVAGNYSMLFAGDAEEARISELLSTPWLESTILKVPHHGRIAANSEEFVQYINPDYAVITSGGSDKEDDELVDILNDNDVDTFLTRKGTVTIVMTSNSVEISQ